jgi:6-phosphofructokinase 1
MLELVAHTPASALGSTRYKPKDEDFQQIVESFKRHNVRYFFYIGGNDSAEAAQVINKMAQDAKYELRVIHIPKTIDNDLLVTDHCPGYGSAAKFVASAFMGDNLDNRALPGVKINILMGRDAGFITAASILARQREDDGPHLIYVPERPFSIQKFIQDVHEVLDRFGRCQAAVSEGIRDDEGVLWTKKIVEEMSKRDNNRAVETDSFGNIQLSGTGVLADFLAGVAKIELAKVRKEPRVRADTYGYLQRSYPAWSEVDAWEARLCGQMAVSYSLDTDRDGSVALVRLPGTTYACGTHLVPLEAVSPSTEPKTKKLPDEYISPDGNYISDQFLVYAGPLVGNLPKVGWFEQVSPGRPYGARS